MALLMVSENTGFKLDEEGGIRIVIAAALGEEAVSRCGHEK